MERFGRELIWGVERFVVAPTSHRIEVAGAAALFCERAQKLSGFNDTAALIWDAVAQGGAAHAAVSQLLELGVHAAEAQEFVEQAASEWLRSGHIAPSEALSGEPRETFACMLSVGRVSIRLRGGLESGRFRAALRGFQGDSADEIAGFDLVERDVVILFFRNGAPCDQAKKQCLNSRPCWWTNTRTTSAMAFSPMAHSYPKATI